MAVSPTPKPKPVKPTSAWVNPAQVALAAFAGSSAAVLTSPLAVAYSGGADSTALLHAACALWPGQVRAIHINHGLQVAAAQFQIHCAAVCAQLEVPLHDVKVNAKHEPGESPEDAARKARYTALADAARALGVSQVLLGQHADDQVETLLLALSRGAGLAGLSAMPAVFERAGVQFGRPLLEVPGASLRDWLMQQGHAFVDDPSNTDERYTRNRIRARLLPVLAEAFPQFRQTFARSAGHAAQAQDLLDEIAAQDLLLVGSPPAIKALQTLSRPRQANALRHWLLTCHQVRPSAAQLAQLLDQVTACTTRGHQIHLKVASGHVQRVVSHLQWLSPI
jgi:tRNA(Ile)-lysidine synthase